LEGIGRPVNRRPSRSRRLFSLLVLGWAQFSATALATAADSREAGPDTAPILGIMEKVGDWQLAHPSAHPITDWTQGAGSAGMMALAGISGKPRYRDAMRAMGESAHWQAGPRIYHADDHCIGQTYAELYLSFRENEMIAPLRARFDAILSSPSQVQDLHFTDPSGRQLENWSWCDALFMGPPTWARLSAATGDPRYLDFAVRNWWRTTDFLYDRDEHLFYRDSTYFDKREANGRKVFWSRGNGWVMAGLVRTLQFLPNTHPDRPRFEKLFAQMADTIRSCQQPDGLWRASLLDPGSYPLRETSGSGFYVYALAWGINQGLLERSRFGPAVHSGWTALTGCVDAEGKLTHVQPIGADPRNFPESATEVYGVGAFLLAGSEVYRGAVLERAAGSAVAVEVSNPSPFRRESETVELVRSDNPDGALSKPVRLPRDFTAERPAVIDGASSRILDSQSYSTESAPAWDRLLFQVDLAPGEARRFVVVDASVLAAEPPAIVKTYARQVPERFNDVAWESDRTAHRTYQVDLIKGEGTVSSGIDVWSKRTRLPIIDAWYRKGDYHNDHGDGMDDYHVSRSRGCGGLGIWEGDRLYVSSNFRSARIITTGPIRSEFELTYDPWEAGRRKVSETRRIRIDAGSNMSRASSVLSSTDRSGLVVAVGMALRPGEGGLARNAPEGWMTYWQPADRDRGHIACAVVIPGGAAGFANESASLPVPTAASLATPGAEGYPPVSNELALLPARVGQPFVYYFGAGWSRSGDFPEEPNWEAYVRLYCERLKAPLVVTLATP
jgi:unsaturated rhamnogalacturonyl hydrolase